MSDSFYSLPGHRNKSAPKCDSSSDSEEEKIDWKAAYLTLQLNEALKHRGKYRDAVAELSIIVREYFARFPKHLRLVIIEDIEAAIEHCDWSHRQQESLSKLLESVKQELPKSKREHLVRVHKQAQLQASREQKKEATVQRDTETGVVQALNIDVLQRIFGFLTPPDLASAMCVCTEWADAASADLLWTKFTAHSPGKSGPALLPSPAAATTATLREGAKPAADVVNSRGESSQLTADVRQAWKAEHWPMTQAYRLSNSADLTARWKSWRGLLNSTQIAWIPEKVWTEETASGIWDVYDPIKAKDVIHLTFDYLQ